MAGVTFLRINGYRVSARAQEVVALMVAVATDHADEQVIAEWLRQRAVVI